MGPLTPDEEGPPAVLARELSLRHPGGRVGVESVDLRVGAGEIVVLLGPNGSGKSTLLRLLATDLRPGGGSLELLGRPAAPPTPELRRRIAWVPDRPVHLEPLTGEENLRFFRGLSGQPAEGRRAGGPRGAAASPRSVLRAFGLDEAARVPVARYSFGMRRRLALAEAFATDPELLLLDEPTVGLDPDGLAVLGDRVRAAASGGAAVVVATNDVRTAPDWASRIVFLHEGRKLEDAPAEVLRRRIPGGTRIRVELEASPAGPGEPGGEPSGSPDAAARAVPGVTLAEAGADHLVFRAADGGRALPPLFAALVDAGARIREVRLREPDLGDLFRELAGRDLDPGEDPR